MRVSAQAGNAPSDLGWFAAAELHSHVRFTGCPALGEDGLQGQIGALAQGVVGLVGDHIGQLVHDQQHERLPAARGPLATALPPQGPGAVAGQGRDVFQ
jgi:hypothetical protein